MQSVVVVYKTNSWHSYASRDLIGIASDMHKAIQICKSQAKKEACKISKEQLFNLKNIKQTQGYSGEGEMLLEVVQVNTLV